jgi:predicted alpha-1,6-mannanase (GH76 family)
MKSLIQLIIILLLLQFRSFAQLNVFGPVAETLQTSTYNTFGIPTANYWWCANGIDVLTDGYQRTRQDIYKTRMKNLLLGIRSFNGNTYINFYYDDMEWLGISSLRAYLSTGDADYLNVANQLWTDIGNGYTNGAIDWNKSCTGCKNTCSNTPAVIMGARLYRITNVAATLQRAKDIYAFVKARLVDATTGAVWDNYSISSGGVNKAVYSYNVGTYIGAGLELYKITGDVTYLNDAVKSAEYAMNYRTSNGLLFADETGGGDGGLFKGIFLRYFALLAREGNIPAATRARYNEAIRFNAETLRTQGINTSNNLVSPRWNVRPGSTTDYSTQLSGVMLVEAAATLDQAFFYKDINYGGAYWGLPTGSYNTAALVAKGIKDKDITSFTIPAGYQVTFFKKDNFSGDNYTVTNSSQWIGNAWNDSTSSLVVGPIGVATFYKDCSYGGTAISLPPGAYSLVQLQAKGILDDDISSLKVQSGYKVTLYWDDNFQGSSLVKTADDDCLVDDGWNDKTTSLIVSEAAVVSIPKLIQAENYSSMSGVIVETTTDTNGGSNVGAIDTGDWMAYNNIAFPASGTYTVEYRVSSLNGGKLSLDLNAGTTVLGALDIPATGAWQKWTTISHNVTVTAGTYNVGLYAQTGGWNINWFRITQIGGTGTARMITQEKTSEPKTATSTILLYPNPVINVLALKTDFDLSAKTIRIVDAAGKIVLTTRASAGKIDVSRLPAGIYTLVLVHNGKQLTERFVK